MLPAQWERNNPKSRFVATLPTNPRLYRTVQAGDNKSKLRPVPQPADTTRVSPISIPAHARCYRRVHSLESLAHKRTPPRNSSSLRLDLPDLPLPPPPYIVAQPARQEKRCGKTEPNPNDNKMSLDMMHYCRAIQAIVPRDWKDRPLWFGARSLPFLPPRHHNRRHPRDWSMPRFQCCEVMLTGSKPN